MNNHITKNYLKSFKSRDKIDLTCVECNKQFTRLKNQVLANIKRGNDFCCSRSCSALHVNKNQTTGSIVNCVVCQKDIYKQKHDIESGRPLFCSIICANKGRIMSDETKEKIRQKNKMWAKNLKDNEPIKYIQYREKLRASGLHAHKDHAEKIKAIYDAKPWEQLGKDGKRRRVLDEQKHCCNVCGLSEWQGKKLSLELEHKDGNHMNDTRDNLEGLCPNCHSLTDTWRGKNKSQKGLISDEILIKALKATETIRQALIFVGLSPRGGNYVRAKRLKASFTKDISNS